MTVLVAGLLTEVALGFLFCNVLRLAGGKEGATTVEETLACRDGGADMSLVVDVPLSDLSMCGFCGIGGAGLRSVAFVREGRGGLADEMEDWRDVGSRSRDLRA